MWSGSSLQALASPVIEGLSALCIQRWATAIWAGDMVSSHLGWRYEQQVFRLQDKQQPLGFSDVHSWSLSEGYGCRPLGSEA